MADKKKIIVPLAIGIGIWLLMRGDGTGKYKGLNRNFSVDDLTNSNVARQENITAQFETPPPNILENADVFAEQVLNPIYDNGLHFKINSWYRTPELNAAVGGAANSHHLRAQAADLTFIFEGKRQNGLLIQDIISRGIPFTKLILEHGSLMNPKHVHIAWTGDNKHEVLRKTASGYTNIGWQGLRDIFYIDTSGN